jgi:hypothetical protein
MGLEPMINGLSHTEKLEAMDLLWRELSCVPKRDDLCLRFFKIGSLSIQILVRQSGTMRVTPARILPSLQKRRQRSAKLKKKRDARSGRRKRPDRTSRRDISLAALFINGRVRRISVPPSCLRSPANSAPWWTVPGPDAS